MPPASDIASENSQMTLNNASACVFFLPFSVLFFETINPHFRAASLPVLSEHSIGNVGIAKTYVLRFQLFVHPFFFSLIEIHFAWQL